MAVLLLKIPMIVMWVIFERADLLDCSAITITFKRIERKSTLKLGVVKNETRYIE